MTCSIHDLIHLEFGDYHFIRPEDRTLFLKLQNQQYQLSQQLTFDERIKRYHKQRQLSPSPNDSLLFYTALTSACILGKLEFFKELMHVPLITDLILHEDYFIQELAQVSDVETNTRLEAKSLLNHAVYHGQAEMFSYLADRTPLAVLMSKFDDLLLELCRGAVHSTRDLPAYTNLGPGYAERCALTGLCIEGSNHLAILDNLVKIAGTELSASIENLKRHLSPQQFECLPIKDALIAVTEQSAQQLDSSTRMRRFA